MLLAFGCRTVPETGRLQLMLMPLGQEMALGADAFEEIKAQEELATDPAQIALVEGIGLRIAEQAEENLPEAEWEFVLFKEDDTLNAFALPGGKVGVYTGLVNLVDSPDELAAVIGHEIAHVTARHGAERMSRATALSAIGVGIGVAARDEDERTRQAIMIAYGLGATLGVELPYSRHAESEADRIGLMYAARAGYDPRAAITFWQKMQQAAGDRPSVPNFLSTHPSDVDRIAHLKELMPEAMRAYQAATR